MVLKQSYEVKLKCTEILGWETEGMSVLDFLGFVGLESGGHPPLQADGVNLQSLCNKCWTMSRRWPIESAQASCIF